MSKVFPLKVQITSLSSSARTASSSLMPFAQQYRQAGMIRIRLPLPLFETAVPPQVKGSPLFM